MAAPTVSDFRQEFPEFRATDDGVITSRLNQARLIHDVRRLATLYLTAHLIVIGNQESLMPDGGAGVVSREKVGPRDIEYLTQADNKPERSFFASTSYGRQYLALVDSSPRASIGARVV